MKHIIQDRAKRAKSRIIAAWKRNNQAVSRVSKSCGVNTSDEIIDSVWFRVQVPVAVKLEDMEWEVHHHAKETCVGGTITPQQA